MKEHELIEELDNLNRTLPVVLNRGRTDEVIKHRSMINDRQTRLDQLKQAKIESTRRQQVNERRLLHSRRENIMGKGFD